MGANLSDRPFALACALGVLAACGQSTKPAEHVPRDAAAPVVSSELNLEASGDDLSLIYVRAAGAPGPRVAEIIIQHSDNLRFDSAEPGEAATAAGKNVIAQRRGATTLRVTMFAYSNTEELGTGLLARLQMTRADDRPAHAEILLDKPLFAPRLAQRGLKVSDPIEF